jgi:phosphatidylglycerol lysyltransferase
MGFLVDVQLFDFAEERRYFVAEREGAVIGLLCAVPIFARGGWFFEDLLRDPRAPNGTTELLVDHAMRAARDEGSAYVTLGLAPLAGPVPTWLERVRGWTRALYDFDGVRAFKAKLSPDGWDAILLAYPEGASANVALYDALLAFARGSFLGFGVRTLLRGPAVVVRALALLLVPWTALLALADARWFPSPGVQRAWTVFDVALAVGLLALSRRWRGALAIALACLVSADAVTTVAEALAYNLPRARTLGTLGVLAVACSGPMLGALTLWGAARRRAR